MVLMQKVLMKLKKMMMMIYWMIFLKQLQVLHLIRDIHIFKKYICQSHRIELVNNIKNRLDQGSWLNNFGTCNHLNWHKKHKLIIIKTKMKWMNNKKIFIPYLHRIITKILQIRIKILLLLIIFPYNHKNK